MRSHSNNARVKPSTMDNGNSISKKGAGIAGMASTMACTVRKNIVGVPDTTNEGAMPIKGAAECRETRRKRLKKHTRQYLA